MRARQLQKSWERLLSGGALGLELAPGATAGLRPTIVESWRRSLATGLDPTDVLAPIEEDESTVLERWFEHPLGSLTHVLTEQLRKVAEESQSIAVITDASGLVLRRVGDDGLKERAAEMNLVEGARYSEAVDGTNGIGTALAADHAFQVFAFEHFNERHHQWVCSGAPVHDPVSGELVGLIDLSSLWKLAHPRSLELATAAARTIEQHLLDARRDKDARLRRRYGDLLTRSTDLLVDRDGYLLAGADREQSRIDIPDDGDELLLDDGSVAMAASLGHGEAYLLRRVGARHARSAQVEVSEWAEKHVQELVAEQAALRQVATLVAREPSPDQLFAAVAEQVARVFAVPHVSVVRYEQEGSFVVGGFSEADRKPFPMGSRWPLDSPGVIATVRQTGRPARLEDYAELPGKIAAVVRAIGGRSTVASPIVVERRLWGAMVILSPQHEPFPESTEARLTDFTELVAAAIANAESRAALARLADEQAALGRVATLVAQGVQPDAIFSAVGEEIGRLFSSSITLIGRFEPDPPELVVVGGGAGGEGIPVGSRWELEESLASGQVFRTGRSVRVAEVDYSVSRGPLAAIGSRLGIVSTVASPIFVEGSLWGVVSVAYNKQLPPEAEERFEKFSELIATAIANAESSTELATSRDALARLADEQAALRRVATMVAQGAAPQDLFEAVAKEVGRLLPVGSAVMGRYEPDGSVSTLASWSTTPAAFPTGRRWPTEGTNVAWMVLQTGRPARIDDFSAATDPIGVTTRESGITSAVGSPVVVEGHLWGLMTAASTEGLLPPDTEARLASFTELVATAIANAESSAELAASRRRIVAAGDEARRRIERDLHDGIQQRLIALTFRARAMTRRPADELPAIAEELSEGLKDASAELREIARGIHPTILTEAGLGPALRALARRSDIAVDVDVRLDQRLPEPIEAAAYYIASEALTNVAKHAHATVVQLAAAHDDAVLTLVVRDDGVGGVDPGRGSGILGLTDRVEALGGTITITSPPHTGTSLTVRLPTTT